MQNKVLNEVSIEQMDDLIKAVKGGSSGFDVDGTLPELQDGEVTDPLMAVGNDGKAKKLPVKTLFGKHNIRGSGNIDLYKHHITLTITLGGSVSNGYIDFISSNSLNCDSLTDLKTLLGEDFVVNAYGYAGSVWLTDANKTYVAGCENVDGISKTNIPWTNITLSDIVTTV